MKSEAHLVARPVFNAIGLCAGVGMLDEGARTAFEHLGIELRTVAYGEWEAAAASQLVALMEAGALDAAPVWCGDFRRLDAGRFRGLVDFIIAGFPCQDISLAGRRAGLDGKRSGLFFDIVDFADACGASGLILENVAGIATATATVVDQEEGELEERAAARVVGELADRGWHAEWLTLSASDVGASHGRERWFCFCWRMADTGISRLARGGASDYEEGRQEPHGHARLAGGSLFAPGPADPRWANIIERWPFLAPATQPGLRVLADESSLVVDESRNHQLRQVGNGCVPLQAALAIVVLARRAGVLT